MKTSRRWKSEGQIVLCNQIQKLDTKSRKKISAVFQHIQAQRLRGGGNVTAWAFMALLMMVALLTQLIMYLTSWRGDSNTPTPLILILMLTLNKISGLQKMFHVHSVYVVFFYKPGYKRPNAGFSFFLSPLGNQLSPRYHICLNNYQNSFTYGNAPLWPRLDLVRKSNPHANQTNEG